MPVSSLTSRATPSSPVSVMSMKPPGRSSVPLAGSLARRHTNSSSRSFSIKATVAEEGLNGKSQEDAKSVTADVVYRQKLIFVPGQRLKNMMKQSGITRLVTGSEIVPDNEENPGGNESGGGGNDGDQGENPLG